MTDDLVATARMIIDTNSYLTLATADPDGKPWAMSRVKYLAQDSSAEGWVSVILGCGFSDGLWWTSIGR